MVLAKLLRAYESVRGLADMGNDLDSDSTILARLKEIMLELNPDAGVGVPFSKTCVNTKMALEQHSDYLALVSLARVIKLFSLPATLVRAMSAVDKVRSGLVDPIHDFVKDEPHKLSKIQHKRWRLIASCSIVDQLVNRLLFTKQNKVEIESWRHIPSKPGFGFTTRAQMEGLLEGLPEYSSGADSDVNGWDWTVQMWLLELELEARSRLLSTAATTRLTASRWRTASLNAYLCVAHSVHVLTDGTMFSQNFYGVLKSGWYNTSSTNSRMRVALAFLIGASWAIAMGDDCFEEFVENAREKYAEYGIDLKDYRPFDEFFEFCSQKMFPDFSSYTTKPERSLVNLLTSQPRTQGDAIAQLNQFLSDLSSHPDFDRIQEAILASDWVRNVVK